MNVPHHRVAIIGAGFAGLGAAIQLGKAGIHDVVLLERADSVGGTWRDNTYPGCQCDVPSHLYSFSFAPNPDWTRSFANQPEIRRYLDTCADRFDVRRKILFGHDVTRAAWNAERQLWEITTSEIALTAEVLIGGYGPLSEPAYPAIDGLDKFAGVAFHSAKWDHSHPLAGRRVGVIGTGASAIQFVPKIQRTVGKLKIFQRTPPWIVPRQDRAFAPLERWLYRHAPLAQRMSRARIYWLRELMVLGMSKRPELMRMLEHVALAHLRHQVPDADLRDKLTPRYSIGCKRILLSNHYYPAIRQPNVDVVTSPIREVTAHGVVTDDGVSHAVDTLIYGTGFHVTDHPIAERLFGEHGRSLASHWKDGAAAYLGTTVCQFPNLFVMVGPNTGLGHTSMVFMMESQLRYIIDCLHVMRARGLSSVAVKPERLRTYNTALQNALATTIWNSGCASWYLDAEGRNTTLWPTFTWSYRRQKRRFDAAAYTCRRRA